MTQALLFSKAVQSPIAMFAITTGTLNITSPAGPNPNPSISIMVGTITTDAVAVIFQEVELPQANLNTTYSTPLGSTIHVASGGDVQAAINSAVAGDLITLEAGASFLGTFSLPDKAGSDPIYIQSDGLGSLPAAGTRVAPSDATNMARLYTTGRQNPVIINATDAHDFRFVGIEIENTYAGTDVMYQLVYLLGGATDIVFDRCYIHGAPTGNTYDGIYFTGGSLGIVDSYIADIHVAQGQSESHGLFIYQASGPVKIENNYISAAGENILFGGVTGGLPIASVSTDVTIRKNYLYKDPAWENPIVGGPNDGETWKVKNILELKEGNRFLIEGNIFENNWPHLQNGHGLLLTARDGPISDITYQYNWLRNSYGALHVATAEDTVDNILLVDNIFSEIYYRQFLTGSSGGRRVNNFYIRHNTMVSDNLGTLSFTEGQAPAIDNWVVRDNIISNGYGILGSGTGYGLPTMIVWATNYDWDNNLVITGNMAFDEDATFKNFSYELTNAAIGFTDDTGDDAADFALAGGSSYLNAATDGLDLGCDVTTLLTKISST